MSSALPSTNSIPQPEAAATTRSSVDFPTPGGPSRMTWRPVRNAVTSTSVGRRSPTMRSSMRRRRAGDENPGGTAGVLAPFLWSLRASVRVSLGGGR